MVVICNSSVKMMNQTPPPYYPYSGTCEERDAVSEIMEGILYLTNWRSAANKEICVNKIGITHVLSCGDEFDPEPLNEGSIKKTVTYLQLSVTDDEEQADVMLDNLKRATAFIHEALIDSSTNGKVLVHCAAGISRSTTVVLAYLMEYRNFSLFSAFKLCYEKRNVIWPNVGFMHMLCKRESELCTEGVLEVKGTLDLESYINVWSNWDQEAYANAKKVDRSTTIQLSRADFW